MINRFALCIMIMIYSFCDAQTIFDKNMLRINDSEKKKYKQESYTKFTRAKSLEKAGLWQEAEKLYKEINEDDPGNKKFFQPLKNILKQRGEWETLIDYADKYSKVNIDDFTIQIEVGEIYIWAGKANEADKVFDKIYKDSKENLNIIKMIIGTYSKNGVFEKAEPILYEIRKSLKNKAFYSMEMGRYYSNRMAYNNALSEYLLYVNDNPDRFNFVSDKIIGFITSPEIAESLIKQLKKNKSSNSTRLLSDLYFNQKQFEKAYDLLIKNDVKPRLLLDFSKDLINEDQLALAERLLSTIYKNSNSENKIIEQAIFNLAVIYEKKTIKNTDPLPLSGFYKQNSFFLNEYLSFDENKAGSLNQAINIYDSLITSTNSIEANYRLGEIRYRILGDLDGASMHFNNIIKNKRNNKYLLESINRLIDILVAKGDIEKAKLVLNKYENDNRVSKKKINLSFKKAQIYFYEGNLDSLDNYLKKEFSDLSFNDHWFNDILELRSLLFNFNDKPDLFKLFSESQLSLKRNKREEALRKSFQIIEMSDVPLKNVIKYYAASIMVLQGQNEKAINLVDDLEGESIYIELSIILKGEIYDFILKNSDLAIDYYLELLERYPKSIFYDQVRLRLRELAS